MKSNRITTLPSRRIGINHSDFERYCQKRNMEMGIAEYVKYRFNNAYINPANYRERI